MKGKETKLYKAHSFLLSLSLSLSFFLLKDLDMVIVALAEADGLFKSLTSQPSKVSTKVYIYYLIFVQCCSARDSHSEKG